MRFEPGRALILLSVSALIVANIFLFGPFTLYAGNVEEFTVPLASILGFLLIPALVLVALLCAAGFFLPDGAYCRYVSVLFALGLLIWLQGNLLVWKYGLLDGQGIDWSQGTWRGWVDGAVWAALLATAFIASRRIHKLAVVAAVALLSIQLVSLAAASFKNPEIWKEKEMISTAPPGEIYEFSSGRNVIHVILDGFQSVMFREIIDEDPDYYRNALEGFTFFREATGVFPTTRMSVPALLSGKIYQNDIPMLEFRRKTLAGKNIINVLHDRGFEVDIVNLGVGKGLRKRVSGFYIVPVPYGVTQKQYELYNSALMLDLVLLRHAPYFLKKSIYNDQLWFVQKLLEQERIHLRYFANQAFFQNLIDNLSVGRDGPVYKYMHLFTTHPPIVVNERCEYAGEILGATRENRIIQNRCGLEHFIEFIDKLKTSGVYDNSLIVLNADHGNGVGITMKGLDREGAHSAIGEQNLSLIASSALPLLAVKPPNSKGPMQISDAQASLTDIPDTISSILNLGESFNGRSAYDIDPDEVREREFYYYKWRHENWQDDYFKHLDGFLIRGSAFDAASWRTGQVRHEPGVSYRTDKIDFGSPEALRFQRIGWGKQETIDGRTFNWARGGSASLFLSLPKDKAIVLTANVRSFPFPKPLHITVSVDGKAVGNWELSEPWRWEKRTVVLRPDGQRPDVSVIEFGFSNHPKTEGNKRPLSVSFDSISLDEFNPYK
jgi:hypothetical protein